MNVRQMVSAFRAPDHSQDRNHGGNYHVYYHAYILFVAPGVLSAAGMDKNAVFLATAIGGGLVTIAMGLFVNYPICLAPGVGLLAFYAFTVCIGMQVHGRQHWGLFLFQALFLSS